MKAQSQAPGRAGEAEEDSDAADSEAELDSQIKAFAESLEQRAAQVALAHKLTPNVSR